MLYYLKRCISHACLLQDQHINDYSWITYLKNQVLNLHHSVREKKTKRKKQKKKYLDENIQITQMSEYQNGYSFGHKEYVSNMVWKRIRFLRLCLWSMKFFFFDVLSRSKISLLPHNQEKYRHVNSQKSNCMKDFSALKLC